MSANAKSFTFGPPYDYTASGGGQGPILIIEREDRIAWIMITAPGGGWARYYFYGGAKEIEDVIAALQEVAHRVPVYAGGE